MAFRELFDLERECVYGILPKIKNLYEKCNLTELMREYDTEYSVLLQKFYHVKDFLSSISRKNIIEMYKEALIGRDLSQPEQEEELQTRTPDTIELVMRIKNGELSSIIKELQNEAEELGGGSAAALNFSGHRKSHNTPRGGLQIEGDYAVR